jgi:hypothetical protein
MKLIRAGRRQIQFEFAPAEKAILFHLLQLYPVVPAAHHRLSQGRKIPDREENQRLLEESLQAQRDEHRQQIQALLNEAGRFKECPEGFRASFSRGEIEWLLQVLNDVRVGSWIALGSPAVHPELKKEMSHQTTSQVLTMEVAAFIELNFLHAVSGDLSPGHE